MQKSSTGSPGGFTRDLDILQALAESIALTRTGLRLTDITALTGREKSQISRALARLEQAGLVTRDDLTRRYVLGWKLFQLAALTAEAHLVTLAQSAMRRIVAKISETVHLCVLHGTSAITIHTEAAGDGFRLSWIGAAAPAHTITAGRVLLAQWSDAELRAAYPGHRLPRVPPTGKIRTRTQLMEECAAIRRRGYALVDEEFETGLVGASAPVFDFRGIAVASLNIAAPKARLDRKLDSAGEFIAKAAVGLSAALGGTAAGARTRSGSEH